MTNLVGALLALVLTLSCKNKETEKVVEVPFPTPVEPAPPLPPAEPSFLSFDRFEQEMIDDAQSLSEQERLRTVYVFNQRFNEGIDKAALKGIEDGINYGINAISVERILRKATPIGSTKQIYRVDTKAYGLSPAKWTAITDRLSTPVYSETIRGRTLRALTQKKFPWVFASDLMFTAYTSPGLYYFLVEQPGQGSLAAFLRGIGVDLQAEFDALDGVCAGFTNSEIALQKNRLTCVAEGDEGLLWSTYDTNSVANAGDNLNETPFVVEARSDKTFVHDAQEHLYTGRNGLLFLRLNGAAINGATGRAEDLAPVDVVINRQGAGKGLSPQIDLLSCALCHGINGIIPVSDQIADHIQETAIFDADDKLRGENIFRQSTITALIRQSNQELISARAELNITAQKDPLNTYVTDPYRLEQNLKQIAAYFFMKPAEFEERIKGTSDAAAQVAGTLLNDGGIGLDLFRKTFPIIAEDLNAFVDRNQGGVE